jgi:hypothetical protein
MIASALAVVLLSPVSGWLVHDRTVLGEGYRHVLVELGAWKTRALPVTGLAVVCAGIAALLALAHLVRRSVPAWPAQLAAILALALLLASAVPIGQRGHASLVDISAGWALLVAIGLATLAVAASLVATPPSRRVLLALLAVGILALPLGGASRLLALNLAEGDGRHYADGSYTRVDTSPPQTLTLSGGSYRIGDAWSGHFEGSGLVVSLTDDPACPDVRGSYHVWAAGAGDDIRWETIVDTCAEGARAAEFVGTWARTP